MTRTPAALGGAAAFPEGLRFARPAPPPLDDVMSLLRPSYEAGQLTNGALVRELEARAASYLGVERVVAVSSCTTGLMLVLRVLGAEGSAVLPSFTFSATAHAAMWNGLRPTFAECHADSYQLDVADARTRISTSTGVLMATHLFGAPCDVESVEALGQEASIPVVFDAAHAFGATHHGKRMGGGGVAEIFSLSPTKLVISGEGGLVATDDPSFAAEIEVAREYGNPGTYDTRMVGLNGRMSEIHGAIALASLAGIDDVLARRRHLAARYGTALASVPGIRPQTVAPGDESTFKDYTVEVGDGFGVDRDELATALRADGIDTRPYFFPPVHTHKAYAWLDTGELPTTERAASRSLSLPIYPSLSDADIDRIVEVVASIGAHAEEIRAAG
jgi:dTDP-4-amino-4,6-dideoxygalactose transaminase